MPPRSVAVIGASSDRRKYGNKAVRAYQAHGWQVLPVNPRESTVEGLPAHASLAGLPAPIDTVTMYVPPAVGLALLPEIAAAHPREVWFNPGTTNPEVRAEVARLGLPAVFACSIVALGSSPRELSSLNPRSLRILVHRKHRMTQKKGSPALHFPCHSVFSVDLTIWTSDSTRTNENASPVIPSPFSF